MVLNSDHSTLRLRLQSDVKKKVNVPFILYNHDLSRVIEETESITVLFNKNRTLTRFYVNRNGSEILPSDKRTVLGSFIVKIFTPLLNMKLLDVDGVKPIISRRSKFTKLHNFELSNDRLWWTNSKNSDLK